MKSILVFNIFLFFPILIDSSVDTTLENNLAKLLPTFNSALISNDTQSTSRGMVVKADHAVLQGEKATDGTGVDPTEHLAPLILMVLAFLISFVAACLWWSRIDEVVTVLVTSMITMIIMSTIFSLTSGLLLADVGSYLSHVDRNNGLDKIIHGHHWGEILCCSLSVFILIVALFFLNGIRRKKIATGLSLIRFLIFVASTLQLTVVIILLYIFPNNNWRLCNDTCVMLGSHAGIEFDMPCADNIAFMALHHASNIEPWEYKDRFERDETHPYFLDYASAIAMHDPVYPGYKKVGSKIESGPITFTLEEDKTNLIATCTLLTYCDQFTEEELLNTRINFEGRINAGLTKAATWTREGIVFDKHEIITGKNEPTKNISHQKYFEGKQGKITYITYRFEFTYENKGTVVTPPDTVTVTFALQDYHDVLPDFPAPVYVQGDMQDVMDVLFIPAKGSTGDTKIDEAFLMDFRKSCRLIIKDAVFKEPSIRFWRKQFNFWINNYPGQAMNASCNDCCHVPPKNLDEASDTIYVSDDIEFRALLHKESQWDFTDHCDAMFSAEMDLITDYNENSSFLHELGHAAFGLSDEYSGGYNVEAMDHLPNVWRTRIGAKNEARRRHKKKEDAVKLH